MWSGERLTQIQSNYETCSFVAENWSGVSKAASRVDKQPWGVEKPKVDNARKLRGIFFKKMIRMTKSSKKPLKHRERLEIQMEKTTKRSSKHREIDGGSNEIQKSKHARIVESHESMRKRLEGTLSKDHEDHIAEKGYNSSSDENLVHKFVLMPRAMKILDARAPLDKE